MHFLAVLADLLKHSENIQSVLIRDLKLADWDMVEVKNEKEKVFASILFFAILPSIASANLGPKNLDFIITIFYRCSISCTLNVAIIEKKIRLMAILIFLCSALTHFFRSFAKLKKCREMIVEEFLEGFEKLDVKDQCFMDDIEDPNLIFS